MALKCTEGLACYDKWQIFTHIQHIHYFIDLYIMKRHFSINYTLPPQKKESVRCVKMGLAKITSVSRSNLNSVLRVLESTYRLTLTSHGSIILYLILIYLYFFCFIKHLHLTMCKHLPKFLMWSLLAHLNIFLALSGGFVLEEALYLSPDRLLMMMNIFL
jgi:hypothetical protein